MKWFNKKHISNGIIRIIGACIFVIVIGIIYKETNPSITYKFFSFYQGGYHGNAPFKTDLSFSGGSDQEFLFDPKYVIPVFQIDFGDGNSTSFKPHLNCGGTVEFQHCSLGLGKPHTYVSPGTYIATLYVNGKKSDTVKVIVEANASEWIKASTTDGIVPLSITFSLFDCNGSGLTKLDFGDGEKTILPKASECEWPKPNKIATHTYTVPGTYVATMGDDFQHVTITVKNN